MQRSMRHGSTVIAVAVLALALAGCAKEAPPPKQASPSPTPTEQAAVFVAPKDCTALLGKPLEDEFLSQGNVLFSSTGGGGIYYPIESTQTGGSPLSCWYGKDMVDLSSFELAAQSLTPDAHEGTLSVLEAGGFTEVTNGDVVTFTQVGDEGTTPAIVHILRPDSWVTGYRTFGGADSVATLNGWLATVEANVYP
ncbi:MAG: hypothetical protein EPN91_12375 [Salinibacterium sp.]|nr:MAG: hypothetical protein EPN91_12375 [Salinibacterium sp.]